MKHKRANAATKHDEKPYGIIIINAEICKELSLKVSDAEESVMLTVKYAEEEEDLPRLFLSNLLRSLLLKAFHV